MSKKRPTFDEQMAELKKLKGNGKCNCSYLQYLNGHWTRASRADCTAHSTLRERVKHRFEGFMSWVAIIFVFGIVILLFWSFTKTCGGEMRDSKECKELLDTLETMSED